MGIQEFYSNFFKSAHVIKHNKSSSHVFIDGSIMWHMFNYTKVCDLEDKYNFHCNFLNVLFTSLFQLEDNVQINEKTKFYLIFDNIVARRWFKFQRCLYRMGSDFKKIRILECEIHILEKYLDEILYDKNFNEIHIIESDYDTDDFIKEYIINIINNNGILYKNITILEDNIEKNILVSNISIYSSDSDFASFFPLCEDVAIYFFSSLKFEKNSVILKNYKMNYDNEFLKILYTKFTLQDLNEIQKKKLLCSSIQLFGMFTTNDYITMNLLEIKLYTTLLDRFIHLQDYKNKDFFLFYFYLWYIENIKLKKTVKVKAIYNNVFRWFTFVNNSEGDYLFYKFTYESPNRIKAKEAIFSEANLSDLDFFNVIKSCYSIVSNENKNENKYNIESNFKNFVDYNKIKHFNLFKIINRLYSYNYRTNREQIDDYMEKLNEIFSKCLLLFISTLIKIWCGKDEIVTNTDHFNLLIYEVFWSFNIFSKENFEKFKNFYVIE